MPRAEKLPVLSECALGLMTCITASLSLLPVRAQRVASTAMIGGLFGLMIPPGVLVYGASEAARSRVLQRVRARVRRRAARALVPAERARREDVEAAERARHVPLSVVGARAAEPRVLEHALRLLPDDRHAVGATRGSTRRRRSTCSACTRTASTAGR